MNGRLATAYVVLGSITTIGVVTGIRLRSRQVDQVQNETVINFPPMPDLGRWPRELYDRITSASKIAQEANQSVKALGELSQLYFSNGYSREAAIILKMLLEKDAMNGRWPYLLGIIEARAEHRETAEIFFATAARLMPDYAPAQIHHANLLAISGKSEDARRIFERCVILAPQDPRPPFGLAKLDFAQGEERAAIGRLRQTVKVFPKYQETHLMLADLLAKSGLKQEADEQRAFLYSGQASPPDDDPLVDDAYQFCYDSYRLLALGEVRNLVQEYKGALSYLQRAAQLEPANPEVQEALARTYIGLGRWDEANKTIQLAIKRVGSNELLYTRLSEVLLTQGKGTEAIALLSEQQKTHPNSAVIGNALGLAYLGTGQMAEAIQAFSSAVQTDAMFPEAQLNLAHCFLKTGDAGLARIWAEKALRIRPESLRGLSILIMAHAQSGDVELAVARARELKFRSGNNSEYSNIYTKALFQAGNQAAERGEHEKAEQYYREGLQANEADGQLHGALGMLCGKLHRYAEAQNEFKIFTQLEPHNALGYILLGAALNADSKPREARESWKTGLKVATEAQNSKHISQLRQLLGE